MQILPLLLLLLCQRWQLSAEEHSWLSHFLVHENLGMNSAETTASTSSPQGLISPVSNSKFLDMEEIKDSDILYLLTLEATQANSKFLYLSHLLPKLISVFLQMYYLAFIFMRAFQSFSFSRSSWHLSVFACVYCPEHLCNSYIFS